MIWFLLGFGLLVLLFRMPVYMPLTGLACFAGCCYLGSYGKESNKTAIP